MSRLRIEHRTVYNYHRAVTFGRHRLVLRPREGHDLRVESMALEITPAYRLEWSRDVFSNSVALVAFQADAAQLEICSTVVVNRTLPFPTPPPIGEGSHLMLPVAYDDLEAPIVAAYQELSYPEDRAAVSSWLEQFAEAAKSIEVEALLMTICTSITEQIKYQRRYAKGVQTPAQTLQLRSGSCRDTATLMMEAARILGLPARFVSGYLDCPASDAGRAAMHAWTEVYLPILGWQGFDPTLGEPTSFKHIAVGVSHHPRGVMPISGMFTGALADYIAMDAAVKIEKLADESTAAPATPLS